MEKKSRRSIQKYFWRLFLFLWALTVMVPILWILIVSLKTNQEFFQSAWGLPKVLQLSNYVKAWTSLKLDRAFLNTVIYVGASLVIRIIFAVTTAYALTRVKFKGRKLLMGLVMLSLYLPGINAMVPTYILMKDMHMLNSISGLIFYSSVGIDTFSVMVLGGFLATIPYEMEESAYMDGAGYFRTLFQIIVPMAKPGVVTVLIFSFLGLYNNFLYPYIMLQDPDKYTIAVKIYEINKKMQYNANWVVLCACIVLGLLPSLLFYVFLQKQVKEGVNVGALKG